MSGALFVINIPTEIEEKRLKEKSKKIRFDIPSFTITTTPTAIKSKSINKLSPSTPNKSASSFIKYGTFHNQIATKNKSQSNSTETDEIKILSSEKSKKIIQNLEDQTENASSPSSSDYQKLSSSKNENEDEINVESEINNEDISMNSPMEIILKNILKELKIEHSTWTKSDNEKFYQIIFSVEYDERYETLVKKLNEWGIGDREGSTVCILHCATFNTFVKDCDNNDNKEIRSQKQTMWNRFMNSFTARINVAQIVRDVRQEATITFDFIVLVISAAILASFGLVGDSTIFLASSMLVSPLMGPIIATIFGTAIKDHSLQSLGIINELIGITLATLVGYIFALIMCAIDEKYEIGDGFTMEILSRCELNSLLIGFLAAIPSGAAAAIAVLGGNTGSLVGVAISASILPPAVNSGIVWAFASVCMIYQSDENRFNFNATKQLYSDNQAFELLTRGGISMCITLSNVICIYIMGVLVLKIKEIAPVISRNNSQFWKHDIKIARDLSKNCNNTESDQVLSGITTIPKSDKGTMYNIGNSIYQNTWSPMGNRHYYNNLSNLQELEKLYMTVVRPNRNTSSGRYSRTSIAFPLVDIPERSSVYQIGSNESSSSPINYRRASMPFETLQQNTVYFSRNKQFRSRLGSNLEKIWEGKNLNNSNNTNMNLENSASSSSLKKSSTRKFIITPTLDNIQSPSTEKK